MKAVVYRSFGSVDALSVEDVEKPTPSDDEVLIAVRAAGVNLFDRYMVLAKPRIVRLAMGLGRTKPLGVDVAGVVEAIGRRVTRFKPGDEVFGTGRDLALRSARGSFAEYVSTPEHTVVSKARNASFEEAAGAPMAGITALKGLRDGGRLRHGHKVLINGASGGIGTFAVQIAKASGAEVTGVCSTRNLQRVRSLGADHVIDYTRDDFTVGGTRYDVILDIVASHTWPDYRRALTPSGRYVLVGGPLLRGMRIVMATPFAQGRLVPFLALPSADDLESLREMMEGCTVRTVIDRTYPLAETADALRYVAAGHTRGKVVIAICCPATGGTVHQVTSISTL